jgi:putative inorganic carbon (HCO3(-)) transporter
MARVPLSGSGSRRSRKLQNMLYRVFIEQKFNSWPGYVVFGFLAMLFALLVQEDIVLGVGFFGILAALCIVVVCLTHVEAGFYLLIFYGFFSYYFSRLLFHGELSVGIFFDSLVLLIFLGLIVNRGKFKLNLRMFLKIPLVAFILMTLCFNVVEMFNPNSMGASSTNILALRKFIGYVLILFTAYSLFDNYRNIRRYLIYILFVAVLSALYGCIQQWHGYFNFELEQIMADPRAFGLLFVNGEFRKFSTMSDPSSFGILMSGCAIFFLIIGIYEKNAGYKRLFFSGAGLMILAMLYSGTRTANAQLVGGLAFFLLLNIEKPATRRLAAVAVVVFAALLFGPFSNNRTIQRFRTTFTGTNDESYKVRVLSRAFIQPYILGHPIGGGQGTTGFNGAREHPGHYLANFQPDSSYVMRAAETGWIGLALICFLYGFTLVVTVRAFFRMRDQRLKVIYAGCASAFFSFYIAEFAQVAIGGISDVVVYYPLLAIVLRFKTFQHDLTTAVIA